MKRINIFAALLIASAITACNSTEASDQESPAMDETMQEEPMATEEDDDENEREIAIANIPEAVTMALSAKVEAYTILEADEITHEDGSVTYDVEIDVNGTTEEHMFASDGSYLGMEVDDHDEADDEEESEMDESSEE